MAAADQGRSSESTTREIREDERIKRQCVHLGKHLCVRNPENEADPWMTDTPKSLQ